MSVKSPVVLERYDGPKDEAQPGTWWLADGKVVISCPGCGQFQILTGIHDPWVVSKDGTVKPSVDHSRSNYCEFHDYIRLERWK